MRRRPNVLVILTDQQQYPPAYESGELAAFRREHLPGVERLRQNGVSFRHHYPMAAACAPSRASLLTGQYPSLHGVTQTDGIAKHADSDDMFWLASDSVPTLGDWFRAGGYRTFFKGKWHASHAHLDAEDGEGLLQSIEDDGTPINANIEKYLEADLLDEYGFSEWVGPEPHGLGKRNTGTVKDPFTADETIALLERLDADAGDAPWLTVCSFLNPHDDSLFGLIALAQGLRYHPSQVPRVDQAPTREEDLSTKPSCQQSYVDNWSSIIAPQPWNELHLKFYYQMQAEVGRQITRVLDALARHGRVREHDRDLLLRSRRHAGRPRRDAREVARRIRGGAARAVHRLQPAAARRRPRARHPHQPRRPRPDAARPRGHRPRPGAHPLAVRPHRRPSPRWTRPLVGDPRRRTGRAFGADPLHHRRRDQRGQREDGQPVRTRRSRRLHRYSSVKQPNHLQTVIAEVDVDGEQHLVKFSRYYDNAQFWTVPGERDERLQGRHTVTVTQPEPDEYELYDLTLDPTEERNLAHPSHADERSRTLQETMLRLLVEQLAAKRLTPTAGELPGYRPPAVASGAVTRP